MGAKPSMTTSEWRETAASVLARIEAKQDAMGEKIDILSVTLLGNGKPTEGLLYKVEQHHKTAHMAALVKNWRAWVVVVCVSILAHSVMEYWGSPILNWMLAALKLPPINLG